LPARRKPSRAELDDELTEWWRRFLDTHTQDEIDHLKAILEAAFPRRNRGDRNAS
jgi:hypothetical protein